MWALPTIHNGNDFSMKNTQILSLTDTQRESIKIAYLILACNEETIIQKTVHSVQQAMQPADSLFVIADNCDDKTAIIAKENSAQVITREERSSPGKSAALVWLGNKYQTMLRSFDLLVILDADTIVARNFSALLKQNISMTDQAIQCQIVPTEFEGSPISTLAALSEIIEQSVFQHIRSLLGLSVRLRGTGMVFKPEILIQFLPKLQTNVEDIALSLLLVEGKVSIRSLHSPEIYDPKPADRNAASRQRARWFQGQWNSLWKFRSTVLKLIFRGPDGWSMLGSIFLKPRWLKLVLLTVLAAVFYQNPFIAGVCLLLVLLDLILILIGIALLPTQEVFIKSLLHLPGFFVMWIKGIVLSFRTKSWMRVREIKKSTNPKSHD
jgi:cellulose synthase/poly-beta-1,6-N-acetylglucosamine synthase-like glycosyltransferase